jgi:hypothetical protein
MSWPGSEPPVPVFTFIFLPPSGRVRIAEGLKQAFDKAKVGQPARYKWDGTRGGGDRTQARGCARIGPLAHDPHARLTTFWVTVPWGLDSQAHGVTRVPHDARWQQACGKLGC